MYEMGTCVPGFPSGPSAPTEPRKPCKNSKLNVIDSIKREPNKSWLYWNVISLPLFQVHQGDRVGLLDPEHTDTTRVIVIKWYRKTYMLSIHNTQC